MPTAITNSPLPEVVARPTMNITMCRNKGAGSAMEHRYDYIIVGAGSSGAVLAARLTEDPRRTVLLLETGPDYRPGDAPAEMRSPNLFGITNPERFPEYQWPGSGARTTTQEPFLYDRGRGVGGSSAINWQVAHRGQLEDFDLWAAQGCVGWSGEELLPAMNRLENDLDFGDAPYHGRGGPITIYRAPLSRLGQGRPGAGRGRAGPRLPLVSRPQRSRLDRHLVAADEPHPRQPRLDQRRLPGAGAQQAQPDDLRGYPCRPGAVRRQAGHRGSGDPERRTGVVCRSRNHSGSRLRRSARRS